MDNTLIKWAILVGAALAILAILYFVVGLGVTLLGAGLYLLGAFLPPKRLWVVAKAVFEFVNKFVDGFLPKPTA